MNRAVLDTDILSELMRGRNADVTNRAGVYRKQFGQLSITTLSILEIVKGLTKVGREGSIAAFLRFAANHEEEVPPLNLWVKRVPTPWFGQGRLLAVDGRLAWDPGTHFRGRAGGENGAAQSIRPWSLWQRNAIA